MFKATPCPIWAHPPLEFPDFDRKARRYAVSIKAGFLIWGDITGIDAPTVVVPATEDDAATTAPNTRMIAQANASIYEMLAAAVDDVEFTAIVSDEAALDYNAEALYKLYVAYANGPIAVLAGPDMMKAAWHWTWPHAAGDVVKQVMTAIAELKKLLAASVALDNAEFKLTEATLCMIFREKMPLCFQQFEHDYRTLNTFTELLANAKRDGTNFEQHPERFSVLAVTQAVTGEIAAVVDAPPLLCSICDKAGHQMIDCGQLNAADRKHLNAIVARAQAADKTSTVCRRDANGLYQPV